MAHPRNIFIFEPGAQGSIIESYVGEGTYFHNAVTEIVVGEGAMVEHVKLQRESLDAFHISTIQILQARRSVFASRSIALGGALARTEINAVLDEGSECTLNGLYIVDGQRHVDTRTTIDHAKPHANSHELYKGILDGRSSAVFNGKIIVRKDAQKTDAKQTNKNLVLSEDATINTKPQLEIFADDVRCTHGATVGQLDADSIFYLRSRGIGAEDARAMLIEAFAQDIVDGIKSEKFREYVGSLL
jgi:Fe-S cluster assembly protein SufD